MKSPRPVRAVVGALLLASAACDAPPPDVETEPVEAVAPARPPLDHDIFLGQLATGSDGSLDVRELTNVTSSPGYDNQPHFTPEGTLLFTRIDSLGEADIMVLDLESGDVAPFTDTAPESEYSATVVDDGAVAVVRVEADSTQRLWRLADDGEAPVFPDLEPVGYFAWADPTTVAMFVLGDPPTLRVGDVETQQIRTVDDNIARSIQKIPGEASISYMRAVDDGFEILAFDPESGRTTPLAPAPEGGQDHAWGPDGRLFASAGGRLLAWNPATTAWVTVADYSAAGMRLTRIAVSPDGGRIALVAEPATD